MKRLIDLLFNRRGDEFAETAIAMPVIVLISIALMNLTMAGFASVNANNAANYAARVGSVTQQGAGGAAYSAAMQSVSNAPIGEYSVSVSGGGFPGAQIAVQVDWSVPNYISGLLAFFGGGLGGDFRGTSTSVFRQEGW
ncbi:MAG: hypothetical protein HRF47_10090 [Chloroflexota bacterium]|jgi:hypothetical protein